MSGDHRSSMKPITTDYRTQWWAHVNGSVRDVRQKQSSRN